MSFHDAYFEDLYVGRETVTPGRTVTEADIVAFAGLSGDYHPLHTNAVFAATGPYERRIAHGLLGLAIASGLVQRVGIPERALMALRNVQCSFKHPVFIGDTVYARLKVIGAKAIRRLGGGVVELSVKLYNQLDQLLQSGSWEIWVLDRASALEGGPCRRGGTA